MTEAAEEEAVELLQEFGLTEYRARAFVGLTRLGTGTAKEVSEVADIPQARVYDCMEALAERGLVDVRNSKPRQFRAVGVAEAVELLQRQYADRVERLEARLSRLEPSEVPDDGPSEWSIDGRDGVVERIERLVAGAESEVTLAVAEEALLTDEVVAALADADRRGAAVLFGSPSDLLREAVVEAVPDAEVVETWTWWETLPVDAGGVSAALLVDDGATLAAVAEDASGGGERAHHAVWADDPDAPLVGVLRPVLGAAISGDAR